MTYTLSQFREMRRMTQINERFSGPKASKAMGLITQYLERRLGTLYQMPGVEHFKNSHGEGYGLRYFTSTGKSFRFNWTSSSTGNSKDIVSIDVWDGSSHDPNLEIQVKGISLTKILPSLADLILRPEVGDITVVTESVATLNGAKQLNEARMGANADEILDELLAMFLTYAPFSNHRITQVGRTTAQSLWRRINKLYPTYFSTEQSGARTFITLNEDITEEDFDREEILQSSVTIHTEMGAAGEQYTSEEIARQERAAREANAIPYEEQLKDMNKLVKAVVGGAANALFIGGAGGCFCLDTELDIIE